MNPVTAETKETFFHLIKKCHVYSTTETMPIVKHSLDGVMLVLQYSNGDRAVISPYILRYVGKQPFLKQF